MKKLSLSNALYVPEMRRNLIFGFLLNRVGMKLMFGSDKLILTRFEDFIGQGCACNLSLFVLDVTCEVTDNVENASSSAYIAESSKMLNDRLGHLNVASTKRLKQICLIHDLPNTEWDKCQICIDAKHPHKPFNKSIEGQTDLLLIHTDLEHFKKSMSRDGDNNDNVEPRRTKKPRFEPPFGPDFMIVFLVENSDINCLDDLNENFNCVYLEDLKTYKETMRSIDSKL